MLVIFNLLATIGIIGILGTIDSYYNTGSDPYPYINELVPILERCRYNARSIDEFYLCLEIRSIVETVIPLPRVAKFTKRNKSEPPTTPSYFGMVNDVASSLPDYRLLQFEIIREQKGRRVVYDCDLSFCQFFFTDEPNVENDETEPMCKNSALTYVINDDGCFDSKGKCRPLDFECDDNAQCMPIMLEY